MIVAFAVLTAIACVLGVYIAVNAVYDRKKSGRSALGSRQIFDDAEKSRSNGTKAEEELRLDEPQTEESPRTDEEMRAPEVSSCEARSEERAARSAETDIKVEAIDGKDETAQNSKKKYIVIKYNRSFTAKLIQSDDRTKRYYLDIKNELSAFVGIKSRISWKWEMFRLGSKQLAKLCLRGKTLTLCLALDTREFAHTKYAVKDIGAVKSYVSTPCAYGIKTDKRLERAKELIAKLAETHGLLRDESYNFVDCAAHYPYEDTDALVERKLIKVLTDDAAESGNSFRPSAIRECVSAQEADSLMRDEVAASLIEVSGGRSDRTKTGIVNIDTLSQNFESGEVVTLDEIKKRIKGFNSKVTYLKVLARGTLDKPLTVEADSFSIQAVKMIALTGGTAVKK